MEVVIMGENSRVKKYEELRNSVNQEKDEQTIVQQALEGFDKKTKDEEEEIYRPSHQRQAQKEHLVEATGEFKNEYLDSFIQEVREYNIKKGVRENDDTRLDILQQLSAKQREKRASYMEDVKPETVQNSLGANTEALQAFSQGLQPEPANEIDEDSIATTREIAKQVQELLAEEALAPEVVIPAQAVEVEEQAEAIAPTQEIQAVESAFSNEQLMEETLKLRTQLDEYEEELTSLNSGIDKNNRLLNIIIGALILMLVAVIGIVASWLIGGGIL